jgi:DNA helicase-2/ATP-dependent DNA helicase PcrA
LIKSSYGEYLSLQYLNSEERIDDLEAMADFARQYKNLNSFLSEVSLQESFAIKEEANSRENKEKIILSTIHQAKGLEWNSVFIIGLNEKHFPHYRALYEPDGLEEERRLFYVGVTRAKKNLYFTCSLTQGFGESLVKPSRFIKEIPSHLLEKLTIDDFDGDFEEIELD